MGNVKLLGILMCCLWLGADLAGIETTKGNAQAGSPIYVISLNNTKLTSTIWKLNVDSEEAQAVVSLARNTSLIANDVFSPRELTIMNSSVDKGELSQAEISHVTQRITQVQQIDERKLLVLIANEICNRNYMNLCFGYYDLQLMTLTEIPTTMSLLKIDYHPTELDEWNCPTTIHDPILVEPMLLNPIHDLVAIPLSAVKNCYTQKAATSLRIVNFSTQPAVTMATFPMATGASWSSNGDGLAYYALDECADESCNVHLRISHIAHIDGGQFKVDSTIDANSSRLSPSLLRFSSVWLNPETLLYQWYTGMSDDLEFLIKETGVAKQASLRINSAIDIHNLYHAEYGAIGIGENSITLIVFDAETKQWRLGSTDVIGIPQNAIIDFNPRHLDLILLSTFDEGCLKQVNLYVTPLSKIISLDVPTLLAEGECAVYAYP